METNDQSFNNWDSLIELGYAAHGKGFYHEAERVYRTALHLAEQVGVIFHASIAAVLCLLGDLYADQNYFWHAENAYRLALHIYEEVGDSSAIDTAVTLKRISEMCRMQDRPADAIEFCTRADLITVGTRARLEDIFSSAAAERYSHLSQ